MAERMSYGRQTACVRCGSDIQFIGNGKFHDRGGDTHCQVSRDGKTYVWTRWGRFPIRPGLHRASGPPPKLPRDESEYLRLGGDYGYIGRFRTKVPDNRFMSRTCTICGKPVTILPGEPSRHLDCEIRRRAGKTNARPGDARVKVHVPAHTRAAPKKGR